jgi:UPF0716 family protein affecting phage T7 exclusion
VYLKTETNTNLFFSSLLGFLLLLPLVGLAFGFLLLTQRVRFFLFLGLLNNKFEEK